MNDWLTQLFDLQHVRFGQEGVNFTFARPIPAWGWVLAVAVAIAAASWSYWRFTGPRIMRFALAGVRALLLLVILFIITGPQLVQPDERIEKDWVLALVDRSGSMSIADVQGGSLPTPASEDRVSRDEQLRATLDQSWTMWRTLAEQRTVRWLGFDAGAYDLPIHAAAHDGDRVSREPPGAYLDDPVGRRTHIGQALEQALRLASARPISGIVLFSDGRSQDEPSRAVMRRLLAEGIPVFVVPLGRYQPLLDFAVASVESPAMAFLHDIVPLRIHLDRIGQGAAPATIRLTDTATGMVLDQSTLEADSPQWQDGAASVTLAVSPKDAGQHTWRVDIITPEPDLIAENNTGEVVIDIVDRPLRVVYFDGYPRWEYRYVKNLLLREPTIRASALMLAANRRYLQEGDHLLTLLPRSPEEWGQFDVVILGDLRAELFSREQLEQLREHVATRGAGLMWIAGPGATPASWVETPLGDLLPFRAVSPETGNPAWRTWNVPVVTRRTPAAERLGLLELADVEGWPPALSDPATGWSRLQWAQRIDPSALKPTAEVLAVAAPARRTQPPLDEQAPLVITMRFGAGRVMYVATDETWRWRYARGEDLQERFWLPLMRAQGRESLARTGRAATLEVTPRRAVVDQPIRIAVTILDQAMAELQLPGVRVALRRADDPEAEPVMLRLTLEDAGATRAVTQTYAAAWLTSEAGTFIVEPREPALAALRLSAGIDVVLPDDEWRFPEVDHAGLARLATQTGGTVLTHATLSTLPDLLPNREVRIVGTPVTETLWDHWLSLAVLITLLTAEWIARKLIRLA